MKNFIKQLFNITLFQLMVIAVLGGFQFLVNTYAINVPDKVKGIVLISALVLLVIAAGVSGIVANLEGSYEAWEEKTRSSPKHKWLAFFIQGTYVVAFGTIFLLYMLISHVSPLVCMLVILIPVIIGNGIKYFRDEVF